MLEANVVLSPARPGRKIKSSTSRTPKAQPEKEIQAEIIRWLEARPDTIVNRRQSGTLITWQGYHIRLAQAGSPDLEVKLVGGRTLDIEVKSATGRVSPEQKEMLERLHLMGHEAIVVRSLKEVQEYLT